jgi:hypothetical protein
MAPLQITSPKDGDVLNRHDGDETENSLTITVRGTASGPVSVNGIQCKQSGNTFSCAVPITKRHTTLTATSNGETDEVRVLWNKGSRKRFRFSIDDNIEFLKDLGLNEDKYASLFDHWYLAFWREMHQTYGTMVHINIYYQTDGFDLSQMPDKWKEEWRANADWLHLSFHALQDKPDRPYRNATYPQMAHDFDLVTGHIRRFAGNEVIHNTTTTHWAECPKDAITAVRDRGIENLVALFNYKGQDGECTTGYYLPKEQCAYCDTRNAWHDHDTKLTFIRCTSVVNGLEVEAIPDYLDQRASTPHTAEMVELLIHEQYFRRELSYYQPTVMDKVRTALNWVTSHGYEPVFWSDGFLGTREN